MIRNKRNLNFNGGKTIQTSLGAYHRALETPDFIFYVNFEESDENASVKMFNRKRELISDNYFASEALFEETSKKSKKRNITWMSEKMKEVLVKSK